jgi:hypothetical protein
MPYLFVLTFLLFLLAAASVAARQVRDLWVLALSGWFLIHGYACFLLTVPVIWVIAIVIAAGRHPLAAPRRLLRNHRGAWVSAVLIGVLFAAPIVIDLSLHWPGEFGRYLAYSRSSKAGHHTAAQVVGYVLWFWWPHRYAWLVPVVLVVAAVALTTRLHRHRDAHRWLLMVLLMSFVATLLFVYYVADEVDFLTNLYVGYFYWSVPFAVVMVIAVGVTVTVPGWRLTSGLGVVVTGIALVIFAFAANLRINVHDNDPQLPVAVKALAAMSHGKPIVLTTVQGDAWVEVPGFLVQAERTGVRTCVDEPDKEYQVSSEFICTPLEVAAGVKYAFFGSDLPTGSRVLLQFGTTQPAMVIASWGRLRVRNS